MAVFRRVVWSCILKGCSQFVLLSLSLSALDAAAIAGAGAGDGGSPLARRASHVQCVQFPCCELRKRHVLLPLHSAVIGPASLPANVALSSSPLPLLYS